MPLAHSDLSGEAPTTVPGVRDVPARRFVIGIDPGLDGAMAIMSVAGEWRTVVCPTPTTAAKSKGSRRVFDSWVMADLIRGAAKHGRIDLVVLEQVGVRPGEGAVGAFSFGRGVGIWEGICAAMGLSVERPTPQRWKGKLGVPTDKQAARVHAMGLFPGVSLARKKDHGLAEALLLAEYGRRSLSGTA